LIFFAILWYIKSCLKVGLKSCVKRALKPSNIGSETSQSLDVTSLFDIHHGNGTLSDIFYRVRKWMETFTSHNANTKEPTCYNITQTYLRFG